MIDKALWALFGNDDEHPNPPSHYLSDKPLWYRHVRWWIRNPAHNFTNYVIGVKKLIREGKYTPGGIYPKSPFNEDGRWNLCLPFISYRGRYLMAYIGWRPGGDFGIKFAHWWSALKAMLRITKP